MVNEELLEAHVNGEEIDDAQIASLISERRLFPITFGSALRLQGVDFLLELLDRYTLSPVYESTSFGAKVYKIARDGNLRLTYMKVTGGTLTARD